MLSQLFKETNKMDYANLNELPKHVFSRRVDELKPKIESYLVVAPLPSTDYHDIINRHLFGHQRIHGQTYRAGARLSRTLSLEETHGLDDSYLFGHKTPTVYAIENDIQAFEELRSFLRKEIIKPNQEMTPRELHKIIKRAISQERKKPMTSQEVVTSSLRMHTVLACEFSYLK
jgi:hypothetical protein